MEPWFLGCTVHNLVTILAELVLDLKCLDLCPLYTSVGFILCSSGLWHCTLQSVATSAAEEPNVSIFESAYLHEGTITLRLRNNHLLYFLFSFDPLLCVV
jgi:hypothetical protein